MQQMNVTSLRFSDVFNGVDPHIGIPNTDLLTRLPVQDGQYDVLKYFDAADVSRVNGLFNSIERVCDSVGLIPLILDVALLRDDRVAKREAPDNFYVSLVKISTEHSDMVWDAYLEAIEKPAKEGAEYQSLITHKDFYTPDNTVFFCDQFGPTLGLPEVGTSPPEIRGYRFFPNRRAYAQDSQSIHANIEEFLSNLDERLNASSDLAKSLKRSRLIVVALPVVRAYFDTPVEDAKESDSLGSPGGTLFVFARLGRNVADVPAAVRALAHGLTNIILRGALKDSISSIQRDEIERESVAGAYSFAHPLKNRLGRLSQAIEQLTDSLPDEHAATSGHIRAMSRSAHLFAEQANLIHFAIIRGASALRDPAEPYSERYMTKDPLAITDTVFGAMPKVFGPILWPSIVLLGVGNPQIKPFRLKDHPRLDAMRIADEFYIQIFFELINNSIDHGKQDSKGMQQIRWAVSNEKFGGAVRPAFVLTNEWAVQPQSNWLSDGETATWQAVESESPSGLQFISNTLSGTGSGSIAIKADSAMHEFSVALFLNGLVG